MNYTEIDFTNLIQLEVPYEHKDRITKCLYNADKKKFYCRPDNSEMINKYSRTFIHIPYEDREMAKSKGYKWCPELKTWYTYSSNL